MEPIPARSYLLKTIQIENLINQGGYKNHPFLRK